MVVCLAGGRIFAGEPPREVWIASYQEACPAGRDCWHEFTGLVDRVENIYWLMCSRTREAHYSYSCSLVSHDFEGNFRYSVSLGVTDWYRLHGLHVVEYPVIVTRFSGQLSGRSYEDGSVLWTRTVDPQAFVQVAGNGKGTVFIASGSTLSAVDAGTGGEIWTIDPKPDPTFVAFGREVILDENDNLYFQKTVCDPGCPSSLASIDGAGEWRWEIGGTWGSARPLAARNGRLAIASAGRSALLDSEDGAVIAEFPWEFRSPVLLAATGFDKHEAGPETRFVLTAFDLSSGELLWDYAFDWFAGNPLLTNDGSVLVATQSFEGVSRLLEVSADGTLVRSDPLAEEAGTFLESDAVLVYGRWIAYFGDDIVRAFDLSGFPLEGSGWNSRFGNAPQL